jgi:PAS domain S-box-containing protein
MPNNDERKRESEIKLSEHISWNKENSTLLSNGMLVKLSKSEMKVMELLVNKLNQPVSMNDIYEFVFWDEDREFNPKTIRNIISKLRSKFNSNIISNIYGCAYILRSYSMKRYKAIEEKAPLVTNYLLDIIDQAQNGISITDPRQNDNPLVFCNEYFKSTFQYTDEEVLGKNLRFLRQDDKQEETIKKIRQSIDTKTPVTVHIRNYTKYGELKQTELTISPIFDHDSGELIYFLGIQKILQ